MNRMLLAVAGLVAFVSGAPDTWAFTTQPVTSDTMSNRGPTPGQDVEGAIRRNYFRSTRRSPDAAVFCTTVERNLEQPICYQPQLGIRAERTSIGPDPERLLAD